MRPYFKNKQKGRGDNSGQRNWILQIKVGCEDIYFYLRYSKEPGKITIWSSGSRKSTPEESIKTKSMRAREIGGYMVEFTFEDTEEKEKKTALTRDNFSLNSISLENKR